MRVELSSLVAGGDVQLGQISVARDLDVKGSLDKVDTGDGTVVLQTTVNTRNYRELCTREQLTRQGLLGRCFGALERREGQDQHRDWARRVKGQEGAVLVHH